MSTSGTESTIARSTSVATSCASSSGSSPGQLQVKRDLGRIADAEHAQVVDLAHARDALRRRERALAKGRLVLLRLDVDDDVAVGQRPVHRLLDRVGRRVALADRRARAARRSRRPRTAVRRPGAFAAAAARFPASAPMAASAAACASEGTRSISTSMLTRISRPAATQHEPGHEQRRHRVRPVVAGARGDETEQHGRRAGEVAGEVERVRLQRRASVAAAGAEGDVGAGGVDHDHRADHERAPTPSGRPGPRRARTAARARARRSQAGDDQDRRLGKRGEMLGLAVTVRRGRGSAGRMATPSATKVRIAATRSVPEWAASERSRGCSWRSRPRA